MPASARPKLRIGLFVDSVAQPRWIGEAFAKVAECESTEIVLLILAANIIAWPVAYYFMQDWLTSFAYHININWLVFALAACIAIVIAVLTVSAQTIKAAMSNPARTLKYE